MTETPSCVASPEAYPVASDDADAERDIKPANIITAICAAMAEVGTIEASGYNDHHRYAFASRDDILAQSQPALAAAGLAMWPHEITPLESSAPKHLRCQVTYRVQHVSGESIDFVVLAEAADTQDKACAKLMSSATKSALKTLLQIAVANEGISTKPQQHQRKRGGRDRDRQAEAERVRIDPKLAVKPPLHEDGTGGDGRTWEDLEWRRDREWVRDGAAGRLSAEDHPCHQHPVWIAHCKWALQRLNLAYRQDKRWAQLVAHTGGADGAWRFLVETLSGHEWNAQRVDHIESLHDTYRERVAQLTQRDLSALKAALEAEDYDTDAPIAGFEQRGEG